MHPVLAALYLAAPVPVTTSTGHHGHAGPLALGTFVVLFVVVGGFILAARLRRK